MPGTRQYAARPSRKRGYLAMLAAVALAGAVGFGLGNGRGGGSDSQGAVSKAPAATRPASQPSNPASTKFSEAQFWQLTGDTRKATANNTADQSSQIQERLSKLSPQAILEFARIRRQMDQRLFTYDLWGAAYVIEDGCSDDCFRDFRSYVISLGQGPYEAALKNPDSLATVAQDAETGDWENADNVAGEAYSSRTGNDFPMDDADLTGRPAGTPFNENDAAGLASRYPRLAARFR
jgi:hypothetical protein